MMSEDLPVALVADECETNTLSAVTTAVYAIPEIKPFVDNRQVVHWQFAVADSGRAWSCAKNVLGWLKIFHAGEGEVSFVSGNEMNASYLVNPLGIINPSVPRQRYIFYKAERQSGGMTIKLHIKQVPILGTPSADGAGLIREGELSLVIGKLENHFFVKISRKGMPERRKYAFFKQTNAQLVEVLKFYFRTYTDNTM